ncbi:hypothetical protein BUE80_DR003462 [Diplocarpon rosae]|nr:hypothetical protein BUE80_DR003462 [Diplocarpon rosae]
MTGAPSTDDGPKVLAEKRGRLSRLVASVKTVLKRRDASNPSSGPAKPAVSVVAAAGPSATNSATPSAKPVLPRPLEPVTEADPSLSHPQATKILRSQIEAARAQRLAERFAVSVAPLPAGPDRETFRIEKPIRLRIHRACHVCTTSFGSNKTCAQCQHVRCKACHRAPSKKAEKAKGERKGEREKVALPVMAMEPDTYWGLRDQIRLTKPNPKPGAQPLVRKRPKQRVRRHCHECQTLFPGRSKICPSCDHVRDKKKYYPDGYPGDAPSPNPARPIKYKCHRCTQVFPPVVPPLASAEMAAPLECLRCKHVWCADCPPAPPARVEPVPDPEVLKSVRAKLAALSVGVANP